jgi:hypothetical protein
VGFLYAYKTTPSKIQRIFATPPKEGNSGPINFLFPFIWASGGTLPYGTHHINMPEFGFLKNSIQKVTY